MATPAVQNPSVKSESKSAKKKKVKAEQTVSPKYSPESAIEIACNDRNQDDARDTTHIRELKKQIRNITKKLSNTAKIDHLITEHPGKSLDELVDAKIINTDQKAAQLKRPDLRKQLAQLDEQLSLLQKIDQEYRARLAEQEKNLTDKFEKEKAGLVADLKEKAGAQGNALLKESLHALAAFLRLAAARRTEDADSEIDENMALEGVLLQIYSGDESAVATMLKVIQGADEQTMSISGDILQTTYARVKESSLGYSEPLIKGDAVAQTAEVGTSQADVTEETAHNTEQSPQTDPTIANASLTEIEQGTDVAMTSMANGHSEEPTGTLNAVTDVADDAANLAAESQWDAGNNGLSESQEWVNVKNPPEASETAEAGTQTQTKPQLSTVAGSVAQQDLAESIDKSKSGNASVQAAGDTGAAKSSWADDQPDDMPTGEGFHEVQRNNNRGGRGRGDYRGRGRGGFRGDGRGRGRGGRGRGAPRVNRDA